MADKPTIVVRTDGVTITKPLDVTVTAKHAAGVLQPVGAADPRRTEGRINGGAIDFIAGIDLIYSVGLRHGRAYLDAVALARKAAAGKPSSGSHHIEFGADGCELLVDGRCLLVRGEQNVILLDDAGSGLRIVGTDRVAEDLCEAAPSGPSRAAEIKDWHEQLMSRLDQLLWQSAAVRSFLESS